MVEYNYGIYSTLTNNCGFILIINTIYENVVSQLIKH